MTYCKLDPFNLGTTQPITGPTPFTQSTWFADPNLKRPYSDQWNFGVQQPVTSKAVLTANYVGSVGRKLDIGGAYNVRLQPGPTPTNCSAATINCGAPFDYIGATAYDRSGGKSNYQNLQMSFKGNAQHGLTYLVSYTWSKSLDLGRTGWYGVEGCSIQNPYNIQADKGPPYGSSAHLLRRMGVYAPFWQGTEAFFGQQGGRHPDWQLEPERHRQLQLGCSIRRWYPKGPRRHWQLGLSALGIMNSVSCSAQTPRCRLHFHWVSQV